jgi:hypothetical protein
MKFEFKLRYSVQVASYLVALTWVTISRAGQCLVNNASMVLGLSSYIAYERAPRIVLR